jgi:hypothetical protein
VPAVPETTEQWASLRDGLLEGLRAKSFRAWPESDESVNVKQKTTQERDVLRMRTYEFTSEPHVALKLFVIDSKKDVPKYVVLNVLDEGAWEAFAKEAGSIFADAFDDGAADSRSEIKPVLDGNAVNVFLAPRGVGPTRTMPDAKTGASMANLVKKDTHRRRRFWLLGASLEGQQVYDVRRAIQSIRAMEDMQGLPIHVRSQNEMGGVALYASLFEPPVERLELTNLPASHEPSGPQILNVLKVMDIPVAAAIAAERSEVQLRQEDAKAWDYPREVVKQMGWGEERFRVHQE